MTLGMELMPLAEPRPSGVDVCHSGCDYWAGTPSLIRLGFRIFRKDMRVKFNPWLTFDP